MVLILTCNTHLLTSKISIKHGHYETPLPRVVFKRVYKIIDFISKVLISNYAENTGSICFKTLKNIFVWKIGPKVPNI